MNIISSCDYFKNITSIPEILYCRGKIAKDNVRISIVGSRRPTPYGKYIIDKIISGLKDYPVSIISGLAIGIDTLVHESCIRNCVHTIAIPGSGITDDTIYPRCNFRLANSILENEGAILSEWENQRAAPWTFPVRNILMAAISDLVIVVEAKEKSGSIITAKAALFKKIPLGAIPGDVGNINSEGPNYLLKIGAKCITGPEDIINILNLENVTKSKIKNNIHPLFEHLSKPCHRDSLALLSGIEISNLNIELTLLELSGDIVIDTNGFVKINN